MGGRGTCPARCRTRKHREDEGGGAAVATGSPRVPAELAQQRSLGGCGKGPQHRPRRTCMKVAQLDAGRRIAPLGTKNHRTPPCFEPVTRWQQLASGPVRTGTERRVGKLHAARVEARNRHRHRRTLSRIRRQQLPEHNLDTAANVQHFYGQQCFQEINSSQLRPRAPMLQNFQKFPKINLDTP